MGQKLCQNSTGITLHDCRNHLIRETWARATFDSSECWKESWRIESFIRMMKMKRRLRWPGTTSRSIRSRASFIIGWTDLDGSLRTAESTFLNKDGSVYLCLLSDGIGEGPGTFFTPCIPSNSALVQWRGPCAESSSRPSIFSFRYLNRKKLDGARSSE
jgi:hypothetical protein